MGAPNVKRKPREDGWNEPIRVTTPFGSPSIRSFSLWLGEKWEDTYSLALSRLSDDSTGGDYMSIVSTNGNTALGDLSCGHCDYETG